MQDRLELRYLGNERTSRSFIVVANMNEELLELIRNWVRSEIDAKIADNEEDEGGYRGTGYAENRIADELFQNLKSLIILNKE